MTDFETIGTDGLKKVTTASGGAAIPELTPVAPVLIDPDLVEYYHTVGISATQDRGDSVIISCTENSSLAHVWAKTLPAYVHWKARVGFTFLSLPGTWYQCFGICVGDSSSPIYWKSFVWCCSYDGGWSPYMSLSRWTGDTRTAVTDTWAGLEWCMVTRWLQAYYDGLVVHFQLSINGLDWMTIYDWTPDFTMTKFGMLGSTQGNNFFISRVFHLDCISA